MKDWDKIHKHNQQMKKDKANWRKCLTCKHKNNDPKQFPCTWCIHLPAEHLDYYEKEG